MAKATSNRLKTIGIVAIFLLTNSSHDPFLALCDIVKRLDFPEKGLKMKKSQTKKATGGTQWSALFDDIFGLKAWHDKKGRRDKKRIPWQWALWGALLFFMLGFLIPTDSAWILLVAIAAAVIIYFARSTEAVEEQVLLLTDNRTPAQKEAHKRREAAKAQRASGTRKPRTRQSAPISRPAETTEAVTSEAQEAAKPTATQSSKPKKTKRTTRTRKVQTSKSAADTKTQVTQESPAQTEKESAATVSATVADNTTATKEVKKSRKPRAPRKTNRTAEKTKSPAETTARRPRKPKAKAAPALTTQAPVATPQPSENADK